MFIRLYEENPNTKHLQQIVDCLKRGGVIIYPTDTVYAFGCDLYNSDAVEKLSALKRIPKENAQFSVICYDLSNLSEYCFQLNNSVFKLLKASLPGPYTFILKASGQVPKMFRNNKKKTIGIRVPDNNIAREIVKMLGNPIITTSLVTNDEINEYITDPDLIYDNYKDLVDIIVDGGIADPSPSTIIDCTDENNIEVIREGKGSIDLFI